MMSVSKHSTSLTARSWSGEEREHYKSVCSRLIKRDMGASISRIAIASLGLGVLEEALDLALVFPIAVVLEFLGVEVVGYKYALVIVLAALVPVIFLATRLATRMKEWLGEDGWDERSSAEHGRNADCE